jgi:hypothetical protein
MAKPESGECEFIGEFGINCKAALHPHSQPAWTKQISLCLRSGSVMTQEQRLMKSILTLAAGLTLCTLGAKAQNVNYNVNMNWTKGSALPR